MTELARTSRVIWFRTRVFSEDVLAQAESGWSSRSLEGRPQVLDVVLPLISSSAGVCSGPSRRIAASSGPLTVAVGRTASASEGG